MRLGVNDLRTPFVLGTGRPFLPYLMDAIDVEDVVNSGLGAGFEGAVLVELVYIMLARLCGFFPI